MGIAGAMFQVRASVVCVTSVGNGFRMRPVITTSMTAVSVTVTFVRMRAVTISIGV